MMVKRNRANSGWLKAAASCFVLVIVLTALAGCGQALVPQATSTREATATLIPSATESPVNTEVPSATPTVPPTATPEPSATPTLPPTATPVPVLGVMQDGLALWCAPTNYAGFNVTSPDAPVDANIAVATGNSLQVKIPAAYCVVSARFNQAAPAGITLVMYDGNSPFLKTALNTVAGRGDLLWTTIAHTFVVNPPFWEVDYRMAILGPDGKELWTSPVKFAKPVPASCPYGGLPDPVTLYCGITDPKEIEPHPDITWPSYYTRVP